MQNTDPLFIFAIIVSIPVCIFLIVKISITCYYIFCIRIRPRVHVEPEAPANTCGHVVIRTLQLGTDCFVTLNPIEKEGDFIVIAIKEV